MPDSDGWDIDGIAVFKALGYIVGLPAFMVGTALFMLGFSVLNPTVLNAACWLYSVAATAMGGRFVLIRVNPRHERQAFLLALGSLATMGLIYALLSGALHVFGFSDYGSSTRTA